MLFTKIFLFVSLLGLTAAVDVTINYLVRFRHPTIERRQLKLTASAQLPEELIETFLNNYERWSNQRFKAYTSTSEALFLTNRSQADDREHARRLMDEMKQLTSQHVREWRQHHGG